MFDLPPPVPAIEFSLASRGISKGLAQTKGPQALVRGELAFGHVYLGAYAKNVTSPIAEGEAAALIGLRHKLGGFDVAASAGWKHAVDPAPGSDKNALELTGAVSRKLGRLTQRVSLVWSPDELGATGRSLFAETGAAFQLTKTLSLSGAIGHRSRTGGLDYTAWNGGLTWTPEKHLTVDLRYYDTNREPDYPFRAGGVAAIRLKY